MRPTEATDRPNPPPGFGREAGSVILRASRRPEGTMEAPLELHDARLTFALGTVLNREARSLVDVGCGSGALLKRAAAEPQLRRLSGIEVSTQALAVARRELAPFLSAGDDRITLEQASCLEGEAPLHGFDAATLVETIEHLDPRHLSALEHNLFRRARPATVVVTTPNREYNALYGLAAGELRDSDHRFEWDRARFRSWARRVARAHGYRLVFSGIGEAHPERGCPSQAVRFERPAAGTC